MVQPSVMKSHKRSKMIENHFYRLYSIMTGSKIIAGSPSKVWHNNFVAVVSVLLPSCCYIGFGISYLCIFGEEVVSLLGPMANK